MQKTKITAEVSDLFFLSYNGDFIIDLKTDINVKNKNNKSKIRIHYPLTKEFKTLFLEFLLGKGTTYKLADYNDKLGHKPHENGLGFLNPDCKDGFFKYDNEYPRNKYTRGAFFKKLKEFLALDEKITNLSGDVLRKYYSETAKNHRLDINAYINKCQSYKEIFPKINQETHLFDFDDIWLKSFIDDYEWNKTFEKLEIKENNLTVKYVNQEEEFVLKITKLFSDKLQSKLQCKIPLLIRGAEGRGKTSLACMFMEDAIKNKDKCFYLNFEDDSLLEKLKETYNKGTEKDNIKAMLDELINISTNHLIVFDNFHNVEDTFNQKFVENLKLNDKIKLLILERGMTNALDDNKERRWNKNHFYFLEPSETEVTEIYNENVFDKYNKIFQITNSKTEDGEDKIHDYSLLNINISEEENKSGLNLRILHHISKIKEEDVNFVALYNFVREQYFNTEKASEGEKTKDYEEVIAQIATINALDCHYEIELTETTKYEKLFKSGLVKKTTSQYNIRFAHQTDAIIILIGYFGNSSQQGHKIGDFLALKLKHYFTETKAINFFGCFMNLYRTKSKVSEVIMNSSNFKDNYLCWINTALDKRNNICDQTYNNAKAVYLILRVHIIKIYNLDPKQYLKSVYPKLVEIVKKNISYYQNIKEKEQLGVHFLNQFFSYANLDSLHIKDEDSQKSFFLCREYIIKLENTELDCVLEKVNVFTFENPLFLVNYFEVWSKLVYEQKIGFENVKNLFQDKLGIIFNDSTYYETILQRINQHKQDWNIVFSKIILAYFLKDDNSKQNFTSYLNSSIIYIVDKANKSYTKLELLIGIVKLCAAENFEVEKLAEFIKDYVKTIETDIFVENDCKITDDQKNQLIKLNMIIGNFEIHNQVNACKKIVETIGDAKIKQCLNKHLNEELKNDNLGLVLDFSALYYYKSLSGVTLTEQQKQDIFEGFQNAIKGDDLKNLTTWIKISIYLGIHSFEEELKKLKITKCFEKEDDSFYWFLRLITSDLVKNHAVFNKYAETVFDCLKNYNPKIIKNIDWSTDTEYKERTICLAYFALFKNHTYDSFISESYDNKKGDKKTENLKEKLKEFHIPIDVNLANNGNFSIKPTQNKKK